MVNRVIYKNISCVCRAMLHISCSKEGDAINLAFFWDMHENFAHYTLCFRFFILQLFFSLFDYSFSYGSSWCRNICTRAKGSEISLLSLQLPFSRFLDCLLLGPKMVFSRYVLSSPLSPNTHRSLYFVAIVCEIWLILFLISNSSFICSLLPFSPLFPVLLTVCCFSYLLL